MADDLKQLIEEKTEETKRHFDVAAERLEHKIDTVAEGVEVNTEQLKLLESVPDKLDKIETRLDVIETTLESVNLPVLKQKFIALEKRVAVLESKER